MWVGATGRLCTVTRLSDRHTELCCRSQQKTTKLWSPVDRQKSADSRVTGRHNFTKHYKTVSSVTLGGGSDELRRWPSSFGSNSAVFTLHSDKTSAYELWD